MVSLDNVLAPNILDWIYSEGFDEVKIPDEVLEAILNGVALLESMSESDSVCKNIVFVQLRNNCTHDSQSWQNACDYLY